MADEVVFRDNADEVLHLLKTKTAQALFDIGAACQGYAQDNTPKRTGALASSWTVAVDEADSSVTVGVPKDYAFENSDKKPAEYAIFVEYGTSRMKANHMLQKAATQHNDEYKRLAKKALDG